MDESGVRVPAGPPMKIAVIGVGGRTGTMLAFELQKATKVLGVGKEIAKIQKKEFFIEREGNPLQLFEGKVITDSQFPNNFLPEIIFLTTKNPVGPVVKSYYQRIKKMGFNPPALVLSQNGLAVGEEALSSLEEIFGQKAKEIQIIRVSLFNPVEKEIIDGKVYISYFLPICLSFGVFSGPVDTSKIKEIFRKAGIEAQEIPSKNVKNLEFSKLFLNLIGIPSALSRLSIREGFKNPAIFQEEIAALREYIKIVKASRGDFLNLRKIPVKLLATLIFYLPLPILILFRRQLARLIDKERGGKPKGNLDEIDYYNGQVVKLGKETGILTPINEEILKKASLINRKLEE